MTTNSSVENHPKNVEQDAVHAVLDGLPVACVEIDTEGRITYANKAVNTLQGNEVDIKGSCVWEMMPAKEREEYRSMFRASMTGGELPRVMRRAIYSPSGFRTYEIHRAPIFNDECIPIGVRSLFFDVTEAEMAHEETQQARDWLESVLSSVAEAIIVTDSLGFVRNVNRAAEELFGWQAHELIGQIIEKKIPLLCYASTDGERLSFQMALHRSAKGAATVLNRNREEVCVEVTASPIVGRDKGYTEGVVSLWRRVTNPCPCEEG